MSENLNKCELCGSEAGLWSERIKRVYELSALQAERIKILERRIAILSEATKLSDDPTGEM